MGCFLNEMVIHQGVNAPVLVYRCLCPSRATVNCLKVLNLLSWCSVRVLVVRDLVQVNSKTDGTIKRKY